MFSTGSSVKGEEVSGVIAEAVNVLNGAGEVKKQGGKGR